MSYMWSEGLDIDVLICYYRGLIILYYCLIIYFLSVYNIYVYYIMLLN